MYLTALTALTGLQPAVISTMPTPGTTVVVSPVPVTSHLYAGTIIDVKAEGWWLEMPEPGLARWRTPCGRTYATTPTVYPTD